MKIVLSEKVKKSECEIRLLFDIGNPCVPFWRITSTQLRHHDIWICWEKSSVGEKMGWLGDFHSNFDYSNPCNKTECHLFNQKSSSFVFHFLSDNFLSLFKHRETHFKRWATSYKIRKHETTTDARTVWKKTPTHTAVLPKYARVSSLFCRRRHVETTATTPKEPSVAKEY